MLARPMLAACIASPPPPNQSLRDTALQAASKFLILLDHEAVHAVLLPHETITIVIAPKIYVVLLHLISCTPI